MRKLEGSFQVCAKLRKLKGREGGSARQTGKRRERKSNNYRKPDQEPEQRGNHCDGEGAESKQERVTRKRGSRRVEAREAESRAGGGESGDGTSKTPHNQGKSH